MSRWSRSSNLWRRMNPVPQVDCHKHERHNTSNQSATTAKRRHISHARSVIMPPPQLEFGVRVLFTSNAKNCRRLLESVLGGWFLSFTASGAGRVRGHNTPFLDLRGSHGQQHHVNCPGSCPSGEEYVAIVSGGAVKSHVSIHLQWQLDQTELNLAIFWLRSIRTSTTATNAIMRVVLVGGSCNRVSVERTDRPYRTGGCYIPAYREFYRSCPPCLYMYPW
jgi:hypothetical protein